MHVNTGECNSNERPAATHCTRITSVGARCFESRPISGIFRLDINHSKLPIFAFSHRSHHPKEIYLSARRSHVWMIALRHQDTITFPYNLNEFRIGRVRVDKLYSPGGFWHIDV